MSVCPEQSPLLHRFRGRWSCICVAPLGPDQLCPDGETQAAVGPLPPRLLCQREGASVFLAGHSGQAGSH